MVSFNSEITLSVIILAVQMKKSVTSAANMYQVSSVGWALYCAIPYVILIFKAFYLWYLGVYLYFTHEEIEVEGPSVLFKMTSNL